MKIAILSDIHSNVFALEAAIKDIEKRGVDRILNLGDILYGPIAPRATYELLQKHNIITVRGNQDRQIYEASGEEIAANPTMQFILDDIENESLTWMRSLPFDLQLDSEIYLCHGTPTDDLEYLLENVEKGYPLLRTDKEIQSLLNSQKSKVIICGHSHMPRTVILESGQLIVNPGSAGLQAYSDDEPFNHVMENFSPFASYALMEKINDHWIIEHFKIPYDFHKAADEARKHNRHDWAHFLLTGRV